MSLYKTSCEDDDSEGEEGDEVCECERVAKLRSEWGK